MKFDETPAFKKDCKRLKKKYRSLQDDLIEFQDILRVEPTGNKKHFTILSNTEMACIIKARLFCRYLKGQSLRIIYAFRETDQLVCFIEVFYKGDKSREDQVRIKEYLESISG